MDLDSFFVSVERLLDPSLLGKPVIVGGVGGRGVVSSCSYEARKFGVHSAMPGAKARQLCPHGIFISGSHHKYSEYSSIVTQIIEDNAPLYQKASIDEFYVDLTGMDRFFGCLKWSQELRQKVIKETGLPISFGLSTSKMISKVATDFAKPNGEKYVEPGTEQDFLDPLPVSKLPMIGEKSTKILNAMGIKTVYQLRQIPFEKLVADFGKFGVAMWRKARGIDSSELVTEWQEKSISCERTFDKDTNDVKWMSNVIHILTEKLGFELRQLGRLTSTVMVKVRYDNFETTSKQISVEYTCSSKQLIEYAEQLFLQHYDKKRKVRLLGIKFSGLVYGTQQINLFDDTEQELHLYSAIDKVKEKYGINKLIFARGMGLGNVKRNTNFSKAELNKKDRADLD